MHTNVYSGYWHRDKIVSIRRKRIGRPRCERDLDMKISKYKMQRDYLCEHHIILGHALLKMRHTSDTSKRMQYFLSYFCRLTIHYPLHFFRFIFLFKNIRYITYQAIQKKKRKKCIEVAKKKWKKLNSLKHYYCCTLCWERDGNFTNDRTKSPYRREINCTAVVAITTGAIG